MYTLAIVAAVLIVGLAVSVVVMMAIYHFMMPDYAAGDERSPEP